MSDHVLAYHDEARDAVVIRMESGREIAVMDVDEAECFGNEVLAASRRESTGYDEFLAQEAGEDGPPTCILTGQPGENPDDCTTHDHETG